MLANEGAKQSTMFLLDSGALSHMCTIRKLFCTLNKTKRKLIVLANGHILNSQGIERVTLDVFNVHGELVTITLNNCVYSQDANQNLIRIAKTVDSGNKFLMRSD